MTNEEVKDANKEVRRIRNKFKYNGEAYDDFTPLELAARIVAFCDSKDKLRSVIAYLKDLDSRYDELYKPAKK